MAADTFESLWRGLLLRVPLAPVPLVQQALNTAYRRAIRAQHHWSALRSESEFFIPASYTTGTVTLTQGSNVVTGSGTTWTTAMTGRQLVVGGRGPFYTFTFVSTTSGTLDRVWGEADATGSVYSIQLIYVTAPADFSDFEEVRDPVNSWRLRLDWTQQDLDRFDPQRSISADAWAVVAAPYTADPPRFELWPRPAGPRSLAFRYQRNQPDLSATTDTPIPPIDGDILREGALAELALWPGTTGERNPYFNPELHSTHEARFQQGVADAYATDQERWLTDITPGDRIAPGYPVTASFLQSHIVSSI